MFRVFLQNSVMDEYEGLASYKNNGIGVDKL